MLRRRRRLSVSLLLLLSLCAAPLWAQTFGEPQARPYSVRDHYSRTKILAFQFLGTPTGGAFVGMFQNQGPPIYFPALLATAQQGPIAYSSGAVCGTAGSATSAYLLKINSTTQCTLTLQTTCSSAPGSTAIVVTGCTNPWVLKTTQTLNLVAPATVNGEANLSFTIMGYLP